MNNLTGDCLFLYAKSKVGTPYYFGAKMQILTENLMKSMHKSYPSTCTNAYNALARAKGMVGRTCTDCSGLIQAYTGKVLGSAQLYSQAYTRLAPSTYKQWANGVIVWRKGHVGVFGFEDGEYVVYEAKGINYGTVKSRFNPAKWSYGLTFSWMNYSYVKAVTNTTWKKVNPYNEPTENLKKGSKGESVKWLQYELNEAGYGIAVDGDFGKKTDKALRAFQKSSKLTVDGVCGKITRKALKG